MHISNLNIQAASKVPLMLVGALFLNIAIFMLIQTLVTNKHGLDIKLTNVNLVDFINIEDKLKPPVPEQKIEDIEHPPLEQAPPPPDLVEPQIDNPPTMQIELSVPEINLPLSLSGKPYMEIANHSTSKRKLTRKPGKPKIDANVVPSFRVPPVYPPRALKSGIEGIVTVEFTIATDGSVKDAKIAKAKPPGIFNKAVLDVITKWRFSPDIINGKPVEKRARQDVNFNLKKR